MTTRKERAQRLRRAVDDNQLTREDVREITGATYRTVCHWLVRPDSDEHRSPPEAAVRLVELHVAARARARRG